MANYLFHGKKPPTGVRFYGVKYFPCGGTPKKEDDKMRNLFLGRGPSSHLIVSATKKYILVARCNTDLGHIASEMNDHIQATSAALLAWELQNA